MPTAVSVGPFHALRRLHLQRNSSTIAADPAAVIALRRCNVALAMEIADLFNENDVYHARLDAAAADAAVL